MGRQKLTPKAKSDLIMALINGGKAMKQLAYEYKISYSYIQKLKYEVPLFFWNINLKRKKRWWQ